MTFEQVQQLVDATMLNKGKTFDTQLVRGVVASDMMSDVLVVEKDIDLLVTSLASAQALRTADIVNASGVMIVNGKRVGKEIVDMARDLQLTVMVTNLSTFEVCGILYKQKDVA